MGCPAAEDERQRVARSHPFTIVLPGDMQVCPGGSPTFTRWVPDVVSGIDPGTDCDTIPVGDMHIEHVPAGLFITIPVEIEHNITFCISDTAGRYPYREAVTADFFYVRLHGSQRLYAPSYTQEELTTWAKKLQGWNMAAYVHFDNDFEGYAVKNAMELKETLHHSSSRSPNLPPNSNR